ncbi:MAG: anti-sigma factor domain-containing protein [Rubrivivax sp.]|jgi:anti-sigma-K factor RskA
MDYSKPSLAEALAAEYAAGTLRGGARRRFENLLPSHPALADAVRSWEARLMPLTTAVQPETPPPRVWAAVQQRLWPAPAPLPWWQRLGLWRALSGTALAAVVGLAVLVNSPGPAQAPVVVVLQATGGDPTVQGSVVASFSGDGRAVVARPVLPVAVKTDRVLELWWATETGKPRSLGLIKADGATVLRKDALPGGLKGSQIDHLAVSVEPPGGSPTGQPTGPVVFYGKLQL